MPVMSSSLHLLNAFYTWDEFKLSLSNDLYLKTASLWVPLCTIFAIISLANYVYSKAYSSIPSVVKSWQDTFKLSSEGSLIVQGYNNHVKKSNKSFSWKGAVILPPSLFTEARKLPSTVLNFELAAEEILLLRFSLGDKHSEHIPLVAHDLARNLNSHIEPLCNEITRCFDQIFLPKNHNPKDDGGWHSIVLHPTLLRMIGITVSRAFVGQMCRDENFTQTVAQFANGVIMQLFVLQVIPGEYLKTQVAKVLPQRRRIAALREMVRKPVMARLEDIQTGSVDAEDNTVLSKVIDMVVLKYFPRYSKFDDETREEILRISSTRLLALMFGAIDTTTMALCQIVFDLIGHPKTEYANPLRKEVQDTFDRNGRKWDVNAINELKLLDSFIKESQRLHSVGLTLGARKVVKPGGIKFSNGDYVPEGHVVTHPLYAVHRDPDNYENPDTFDGFRFARAQDDETRALSGPQISEKFLAFGTGRYACPGRAFALMMMKLMMIHMLMKYDFKETERPKDWSWGNGLLPDMKMKVLVKEADSKIQRRL